MAIAIEKPGHELQVAAQELEEAASALRRAADAGEWTEAVQELCDAHELAKSGLRRISREKARL